MAALPGAFNPGAVAVSAATAQTVVQILAPTNQRLHLTSLGLSFDGSSAGAPVVIRLLKQTTAGTMSSGTAVRVGPGSETPQAAVQYHATAEPTASDVYEEWTCQPTGNILLPLNQVVPGGGRIGIECTSPVSCNAYPTLKWWE